MPIFARRVRVHEVDDPPPRRRAARRSTARCSPGVIRPVGARRRPSRSSPGRRRRAPCRRGARGGSRRARRRPREYMSIGETTTRLRQLQAAAAGTAGTSAGAASPEPLRPANQPSTAADELRVAQPQVVVGDPAAAGQEVERELRAGPGRRTARGSRTTRGWPAPRAGWTRRPAGARPRTPSSAASDVGLLVQAGGQRQRVLHRQLGAGADREVRGVRGVAEQHDVAVRASARCGRW